MNGWTIGIGQSDITPGIGDFCSIRMVPGKKSTGIHDRLKANAVVLEKNSKRLILLSADAVQIPANVVRLIKTPLMERYDLAEKEIVIQATHAHHAPDIVGEEFVDNRHQITRLVQGCVDAVNGGFENRTPGLIGWGCTMVASPINRFQWRTGGRDIKRVDRRIDLLKITDLAGKHRCLLWHFAAHPTTAMRDGFETSRDYYGEVNDILEAELAGTAVFSQGACANINLVVDKRLREKTHYHARHIADRILEAVPAISCSDEGGLAYAITTVDSPITSRIDKVERDSNPEEVKNYFRTLPERVIDYSRPDEEFKEMQAMRRRAQRIALLEDYIDKNRYTETATIQAFRIGDRLGVTIPGEPFVELQLELQSRFPEHRAMVFGYANGHIGYIPDEQSFEVESYETVPSYMKRAGKKSGTMLVDAGTRLLKMIFEETGC